jgi:hypothetical protein
VRKLPARAIGMADDATRSAAFGLSPRAGLRFSERDSSRDAGCRAGGPVKGLAATLAGQALTEVWHRGGKSRVASNWVRRTQRPDALATFAQSSAASLSPASAFSCAGRSINAAE